jgi:Flp pilus assembly protein TadG
MRRGVSVMIRMFMKWRLNPDDERGATVVIVLLSLVAMFGMLVLVVDVGGLLWKRRELVNGSDSGALAAAKTCADEADATDPEIQSDTYATENVGNLTGGDGGIINIQGCDSGQSGFVTVQYHQNQKLYFAQVLGFGSTNGVTTKATAAWGPLAGGNVVPIVVESGTLQGTCHIPSSTPVDPTNPPLCPLWYDNNTLGSADWGFMNLDQWNVAGDANCSNAGTSDRSDWIHNDFADPLLLNGDPLGSQPTYVCVDTGHSAADWQDLVQRMAANPFVLLPVNDCAGQVDSTGNVTPCPATPDKYDIIGFIKLKLVQVLQGDDQTLADSTPCAVDCGGTPPTTGDCGNGVDLGLGAAFDRNLAVLADNDCGAPTWTTIDSIPYASVSVFVRQGNNVTPFVGCPPIGGTGCDYRYNEDPVNTVGGIAPFTLKWVNVLTRSVPNKMVKLSWTVDGIAPTPGICHPHTSDPNAICVQMAYMGFSTGGDKVGVGQLFGTFGYVLCDRTLGTCPDQ